MEEAAVIVHHAISDDSCDSNAFRPRARGAICETLHAGDSCFAHVYYMCGDAPCLHDYIQGGRFELVLSVGGSAATLSGLRPDDLARSKSRVQAACARLI